MPGLLIRVFHFHIGPGMIFAEYSRRGTGAWAWSIFNDRACHSQNVSSFSRQVSLAPRRFQNVSKPSLHYGKKKKFRKKVVREEVYSDWVSNPDIIGHFFK